MDDVTQNHEEKETLIIDVMLPGHDERVTTALFTKTREELLERDGGVCFACGYPESVVGPLEAHHAFIERCLANAVDWKHFCETMARFKKLVDHANDFCVANPELPDIMTFVDDMTANGMLLCKPHHTGKDEGIHAMPLPLWWLFSTGKDGFQFTSAVAIKHEQDIVDAANDPAKQGTGYIPVTHKPVDTNQ